MKGSTSIKTILDNNNVCYGPENPREDLEKHVTDQLLKIVFCQLLSHKYTCITFNTEI